MSTDLTKLLEEGCKLLDRVGTQVGVTSEAPIVITPPLWEELKHILNRPRNCHSIKSLWKSGETT